jgi:hypothetical protein
MKWNRLAAALFAAGVVGGNPAGAQQQAAAAAARQQRTVDSLAATLRALQARLDSLAQAGVGIGATGGTAAAARPGAYMNVSYVGLTNAGWSTEPDVTSLQTGDHDPRVRGFTLPNSEIVFDGTVDPYFKGFLNLVHKLDPGGETGVELEESYLLTTSLPGNLQFKVGQFFTEFGRQNVQHPHSWGFADQPLAFGRMFGSEGLRGQGARLSWLLPTRWYTEVMVTAMNSAGGTTFSFRSEESPEIHGGAATDRGVRGLGDLLYVPRIATSVDLTNTQVLLAGASAAVGPNSGGANTRTRIVGADLYWKWKSPTAHQGFPFVSLQAEYLSRQYEADARAVPDDASAPWLAAETLRDDGAYGQLLWGIRARVVAGLRGEYTGADRSAFVSPERGDRTRWSSNVTWYPSEYSKIRVQYNFDQRAGMGRDHSLWFQFEFLLGAHAAHKF